MLASAEARSQPAKPSRLDAPLTSPGVSAAEYIEQSQPAEKASLDQRVLVALERSPYVPTRLLRFETGPGRVRLHGMVRSYFQKQMAQEAVRRAVGEIEIVNELEVVGQ